MNFVLSVELDNAAHHEARADELWDNFEKAWQEIASGQTDGRVKDSNGNTVGEWRIR